MRSRADFQVILGFRDAELDEEQLRHLAVVMLAGVDDAMLDHRWSSLLIVGFNGTAERGQLNELGPRAYDADPVDNSAGFA
jgi:hypothetical protein